MKIFKLLSLLIIFNINSSWSQSEDDFYDVVSANVMSGFTLKAGNCGQQKYLLQNLYFVDQTEEIGKPNIIVTCRQFETMIQPLQKLELKLRANFKTHYQLKNLNLIIADVLKNAVFEHSVSTLLVPWHFDAGSSTVNLKNPSITLPILLHEYGHYIIHSNYAVLNLDKRAETSNASMTTYFDGLHELMSDVLVVADTQNPDVMVKALQSTKFLQYPNGTPSTDILISDRIKSNGEIKLAKYLLTARDFDDRKNDLNYLVSRMKNGDKMIIQGYVNSPHSLFSPVRKFLWDRVLSNASIRQKVSSAELTKFLFDEISKFYGHILNVNLPKTEGPVASFQMINSKLINWLTASISKKFPESR